MLFVSPDLKCEQFYYSLLMLAYAMLYASGRSDLQITTHFLINMAFAAYLLENAIWCFPGVGYLRTFLSLTKGFLYEPPGPNVRHFQLFKNKNGTEMLDKCRGGGGGHT